MLSGEDYCALCTEIVPLEGARTSIRQVYVVDHDELYPYCPHEHVRQDITVVVTAQTHTRKKFDAVAKKEVEEKVVTVARMLREAEPPESRTTAIRGAHAA
jgi:hypothetical protein